MRLPYLAGAAAIGLCLAACGNPAGNGPADADAANGTNSATAAANAGAETANGAADNGTAGTGSLCAFDNGGSRAWEAWVDAMPGTGPRPALIVTAQVRTQRGYAGELRRAATVAGAPPTQHFDLELVEAPRAPGGWQAVRAEIRPSERAYAAVVIDCGGHELQRIAPVRVTE
ncbi:MAG TPA: hypothetical protein VMG08_09795 [Allosphingosinicella sp.]|nr:hypothetical protein [Allosphingosinicella sp.]